MLPEIFGFSTELVFCFLIIYIFSGGMRVSSPLSKVIGGVMGASNKFPQLLPTSQTDVSSDEPILRLGEVPKAQP